MRQAFDDQHRLIKGRIGERAKQEKDKGESKTATFFYPLPYFCLLPFCSPFL
jgi:hypothetical protein